MVGHVWWIGALVVSVQTGLLYSELCDSDYANGNNGPFGYGQHATRYNLATGMVLLWVVHAVVAALVFRHRGQRMLGVGNVAIGLVGAWVAVVDAANQFESNPYCTNGGVVPPLLVALALITTAVALNFGIAGPVPRRWPRRGRARCDSVSADG